MAWIVAAVFGGMPSAAPGATGEAVADEPPAPGLAWATDDSRPLDVDAWQPIDGTLTSTEGSLLKVAGAGVRSGVAVRPDSVYAFAVAVKGGPSSYGERVRAVIEDPATGERTLSAPVELQPWWQTVAVSAPIEGSRARVSAVREGGDSSAGGDDSFTLANATVLAASATTARVSQRQLIVNGSVLTMKGYNYIPTPPGHTPFTRYWYSYPAQCESDAQLMREAGVNVLRAHYLLSNSPQGNIMRCLDAFANAGVYVMWLVDPGDALQTDVDSDAWVEAYKQTLKQVIDVVRDHRATIGYVLSNEVKGASSGSQAVWFRHLEEVAAFAKSYDPDHVTSTSLRYGQFFGFCTPGEACWGGVQPSTNPHVDMWGVNLYWPFSNWSGLVSRTKSATRNRPVWLSEWGTDRYHCANPPPNGNCQFGGGTVPTASHEDADGQSASVGSNWNDIAAHLSAASPADGAVAGGTNFMWSDLWWFAIWPFTSTQGGSNPETHDVGPADCCGWNVEWFGANHNMPDLTAGPRVTTKTYDTLGLKYRGTAGPVVSNVAVSSVTPCTARITWTTNVATYSRVDFGTWSFVAAGAVNDQLLADNFIADQFVQQAGLRTSHSVTLTGLSSQKNYRAYARGFTSSGRPGSSNGVYFRTPAPRTPLTCT